MEQVKPVLDYLDDELSKFPIMNDIEKKTKVSKVYIASAMVFLASLLLLLNFGGVLVSNLIGFLYPAYASFEALETTTIKDDQLWLTYWIIFAFFSVIEVFSDKLLSWFPFYYLIKSVFLMWCYFPQTQGARFLYQGFVRPLLMNMQGKIQEYQDDPKKFARNVTTAAADRLHQVKASLDKKRGERKDERESEEEDPVKKEIEEEMEEEIDSKANPFE